MEKIIYALWRKAGESREALNARLKDEVAPALLALPNVRGLRFNLQDDAVTRAEPLRQLGSDPQMDAAAQIWVDVAHDAYRKPVDDVLVAATSRIAAWLVAEAAVIPNTLHPSREGARTEGWSQFCFIKRPEKYTADEWRHNWQVLRSSVGVETQSNFEYVQNYVVHPLIEGPESYAGMVEECFPTDAMDDPLIFYDAPGDQAKFEANLALMMESCARFVQMPGGIDVLPNSQYEYRKLA